MVTYSASAVRTPRASSARPFEPETMRDLLTAERGARLGQFETIRRAVTERTPASPRSAGDRGDFSRTQLAPRSAVARSSGARRRTDDAQKCLLCLRHCFESGV